MALSDSNVDETMADDWKAIQEKYASEGESIESGERGPPETDSETQDPVAPPVDGRNKDGTFAKKTDGSIDGESKPAKEGQSGEKSANRTQGARSNPPKEEGAADKPPGESADPTAIRAALTRAPSTWKATERIAWDKVPAEARAAIHRRESEMAAGVHQLMPDAQFGRSIRGAVEPYRMLIEAEGGTPEKAIGELLKTAALFRVGTNEQKARAVAGIVQQFGIDMRVLMPQGQQPTAQSQQFHDPRFDQFLAQQNQERQQAAAREQRTLEGTVNQFMSELDDNGQPARPYLSDVLPEMLAMIPQIKGANPSLTNAQALQEAYQRATWANPEVRTLLQREAAAASGAQSQAENQIRVREARRAASVNVPRRASIPSLGKPGTMEDTIAATARELGLIT